MSITIGLDITKSLDDMEKRFMRGVSGALNAAIKSSKKPIEARVTNLIKELIRRTPEHASLFSGKLKIDFGLGTNNSGPVDPGYALIQIVDMVANNIVVTHETLKYQGGNWTGGLLIEMVQSDHQDVLTLNVANYSSNSYDVGWLDWLLTKGDTITVADWDVLYKPAAASRSGGGLMFRSKKGRNFRVDPQFAGVYGSNWLTRAFTLYPDTERLLGEIVEEEITSVLI